MYEGQNTIRTCKAKLPNKPIRMSDKTIHHRVELTLTYGNRSTCSGKASLRHTEKDCLMLLGSPPDMVHSILLRRTHPSTQITAVQTTQTQPFTTELAPAIADCRYKAPLTPRPAWSYFVSHFVIISHFKNLFKYFIQKSKYIL